MRCVLDSDVIFPEVTWRATPPDGALGAIDEETQEHGGSAVYPPPPIHGGSTPSKCLRFYVFRLYLLLPYAHACVEAFKS